MIWNLSIVSARGIRLVKIHLLISQKAKKLSTSKAKRVAEASVTFLSLQHKTQTRATSRSELAIEELEAEEVAKEDIVVVVEEEEDEEEKIAEEEQLKEELWHARNDCCQQNDKIGVARSALRDGSRYDTESHCDGGSLRWSLRFYPRGIRWPL